jgi:hypothetical protein
MIREAFYRAWPWLMLAVVVMLAACTPGSTAPGGY